MKFISHKKIIPLILIIILLGLFLVNIKETKASIFGNIAESMVEELVIMVSWWGVLIGGFLVTVCALILEAVLNFGFVNLSGVEMGWTICRDVVNMFFILGLVVIAFATILRIETYGMKALLPKLLIIAILINFSFLICGIIIDASQIIANYFLNKVKGEPPGSIGIRLLESLNIGSSFNPTEPAGKGAVALELANAAGNFVKFLISATFISLVLILTCLALIVGAILLLIRIGALWILMILAPFAWFFSIFPGLKGMTKKWWTNFLKYAFFAPIYVFFIYLIVYISPAIFSQAQTVVKNNVDETFLQNLESFALTQMAGSANLIFGFVFVVMLLLGAPIIATSMGIHSTQAVLKFAKGTVRNALRAGERFMVKPPEWTKKFPLTKPMATFFDKYGKFVSPTAWKEAIGLREERMKRRAMMPAAGDVFDVLNRALSMGKDKTFKGQEARHQLLNERIKEMAVKGALADRLIADAESAADAKIPEDVAANLYLLGMQKDLADEFSQKSRYGKYAFVEYSEENAKKKHGTQWKGKLEAEIINRYGDLYPELRGKKWEDMREYKGLHNVADPFALKRAVFNILKDSGLSETDAGSYAAQIANITFSQGEHSAFLWSTFKDGKWQISDDDKHKDVTLAKLGTIAPRYAFQHGTSRDFLDLAADGTPMGFHDIGLERLKKMTMTTKQIDDLASRFREWRDELRVKLSNDRILTKIRDMGNQLGGNYKQTFNYFADKLEEYKKGSPEKKPLPPEVTTA